LESEYAKGENPSEPFSVGQIPQNLRNGFPCELQQPRTLRKTKTGWLEQVTDDLFTYLRIPGDRDQRFPAMVIEIPG
jgi:hypothetical protein